MTWRDNLRPASFRGVAFNVTTADGEFGRRTVTHEYPLRDKPFVEDLGRKARTLSFEALVIGANYMAARDALLRAFEQPGPGTLIHPYLGQAQVTVTDVRLRESTAEGGMARFAVTCVEAGELTFPTASAETASAVASAADAAVSSAQTAFTSSFNVSGRPQFVASASATILGSALASVQAAAATVRGQAGVVATLARDVGSATAAGIDLLYDAGGAANALVGSLQTLIGAVTADPAAQLSLARVFFRFGADLPAVQATTASRLAQQQNQAALIQLTRAVAVAEGARASTLIDFDSYQAAAAARDELADVMTTLMNDGAPDELYESLRALRRATVRDITQRGADLARVVSYTPARTLPALVVAQQLYADATRAADVTARNALPHPLFVPGAQALEVLTD